MIDVTGHFRVRSRWWECEGRAEFRIVPGSGVRKRLSGSTPGSVTLTGRAPHDPPGSVDRIIPNMARRTRRRDRLSYRPQDDPGDAHRRIAALHREAPPSRRVTAQQRIVADLVDVVTTWRNVLEQACQATDGRAASICSPSWLLTRRMQGISAVLKRSDFERAEERRWFPRFLPEIDPLRPTAAGLIHQPDLVKRRVREVKSALVDSVPKIFAPKNARTEVFTGLAADQ